MAQGGFPEGYGGLVQANAPWMDDGACRTDRLAARGISAAVFFSDTERDRVARLAILEAKEVCRGCPVRSECDDWAEEHRPQGIWAGMTEKERRLARRARSRLRATTTS